jgi:hypothetical protein
LKQPTQDLFLVKIEPSIPILDDSNPNILRFAQAVPVTAPPLGRNQDEQGSSGSAPGDNS